VGEVLLIYDVCGREARLWRIDATRRPHRAVELRLRQTSKEIERPGRQPKVRLAPPASRRAYARPASAIDKKLRSRSSKMRLEALELVAARRPFSADHDVIATLTRDPSELVRIQAAETLGLIGASSQLPALMQALDDRSDLVRSYAATSIGLLRRRSAIPALEARLRQERSDQARLGLLVGLHSLGRKRVIREVLALLSSDDFEVRIAAGRTLSAGLLTPSDAANILEHLERAAASEQSVNARVHLRNFTRKAKSFLQRMLRRMPSRRHEDSRSARDEY
jgi:hypothetical protein